MKILSHPASLHLPPPTGRNLRCFARLASLLCALSFCAISGALITGCSPTQKSSSTGDETESATFKRAKEKAALRDFNGAIELYEESLRENPNLAMAHFELGVIYDDKLGDYVSGIYHYRRYLKLRPSGDKSKIVQEWISKAELDFASTLPSSPVENADHMAKLQKDNLMLKSERDDLQRQLGDLRTQAEKKIAAVPAAVPLDQATSVSHSATSPTTSTSVVHNVATAPVGVANPIPKATPVTPAEAAASATPVTSSNAAPLDLTNAKQHVVATGDTLWKIAAKYYPGHAKEGVDKIVLANQTTLPDPKKLKIGQTLLIP